MPVSTTTMINSIVTYLGKQLTKTESLKDFFNDLTEETINWIKPLFIKEDGTLQKEVQKFKNNPTTTKQQRLELLLQDELEENPKVEEYIQKIFEKIETKERTEFQATNIKGKNINLISNQKGVSGVILDFIESTDDGDINVNINHNI